MAYVHPRSTSWGSVLGGWLAALGSLAIFFPLAALALGVSPAAQARVDDPTLALPLVLALFISWVIGGYVAGRMAGSRRSWHGLMSAVWGLFVALAVALVAASNVGALGNAVGSLPQLDLSGFGNATVFGFVLGIAVAIIGGWLGGLLSPAPFVAAAAPRETVVARRTPVVAKRERDVAREGPVRQPEPSFWDEMTGKDEEVVREREATTGTSAPAKRSCRPRARPARNATASRSARTPRSTADLRAAAAECRPWRGASPKR